MMSSGQKGTARFDSMFDHPPPTGFRMQNAETPKSEAASFISKIPGIKAGLSSRKGDHSMVSRP